VDQDAVLPELNLANHSALTWGFPAGHLYILYIVVLFSGYSFLQVVQMSAVQRVPVMIPFFLPVSIVKPMSKSMSKSM
jgi:hypothetical protein